MASVKFENVRKTYGSAGQQAAVENFDMMLEEGTLVTLLGPSGCGKTTTLRMLAGFERPTAGRIAIGGADVTDLPVNRRDVGIVFQNYALFPHMSVRENVQYGLESRGPLTTELKRRIDDILDLMKLTEFADRAPNRLSGGQQQRVAVARAVVTRPRVLLFDEPLSNLDAQLRERVRDDLRAIQQELGLTSLYVTHDQSEALAISDRVVVMEKGRIAQDAPPEDIYARPASEFVARFIGRANIIDAELFSVDGQEDGAMCVTARAEGLVFSASGPAAVLAGKQQGARLRCIIRPEKVKIVPGGGGPAFRVQRRVFQGMHVEHHLDFGTSGLLALDFTQAARFAPGDLANLDLSDVRAWIVA